MKIYTKNGDHGQTKLIGGATHAKSEVIFDALGDLDELNSWLGFVLTDDLSPNLRARLVELQHVCFELGSSLAGFGGSVAEQLVRITALLEADIDEADSELPPLRAFILPGGSVLSSRLHIARTICRRAERQVVKSGGSSDQIAFVNRLSDWLFVQARFANYRADVPDTEWKKL